MTVNEAEVGQLLEAIETAPAADAEARTVRDALLKVGMSPPDDLDHLSQAELKGLVVKQWEQIVELQRMVAALRDEIARLKGGPGRPNLKPSGMERGTEPKPPGSGERKRPRGSTRSKLAIDEERTVTVTPPPGSRFKGSNGGHVGVEPAADGEMAEGRTRKYKTQTLIEIASLNVEHWHQCSEAMTTTVAVSRDGMSITLRPSCAMTLLVHIF